MSRRIDVELTSTRDDGTWTWRAAGAKQPKGVADATLLPQGSKVGDVFRVEADFDIDGITILSVVPTRAKAKERTEPQRIEILGRGPAEGGVTTSLVGRADRPRRDRDRDRPRDGSDRGPRTGGGDRGPRTGGGDRGARTGGERGPRTGAGDGGRPDRGPREGARSDRPDGAQRTHRGPRPERGARPSAPAKPDRPKPKRLSPANVHRKAILDTLPPEHQPIAEQVLRGGLPAVRQALQAQNAAAKAENQPEQPEAPLIAIAEELLPRLKLADWRDRAEAAAKDVDEIALRDLRSVVAGADAVARDDETRALASTLREALQRRVTAHREQWVTDIGTALDENRLVRALRLSSRAPDPGTRLPADLAVRLAEASGAALGPEATADRWAAVLEAVVASPVRSSVKPAGLPADPPEALLQAARQAAGRIPALAPMLGIAIPPPPGPARPGAPARGGKSRTFGRSGQRPAPPAAPAAAAEPAGVAPEAADQPVVAEESVAAQPAPAEEPAAVPEAAPAAEPVEAQEASEESAMPPEPEPEPETDTAPAPASATPNVPGAPLEATEMRMAAGTGDVPVDAADGDSTGPSDSPA